MKLIQISDQIKKHEPLIRKTLTEEPLWDLCNKVLYDICQYHPLHVDSQVIIMKTSIIGRVYGVRLERVIKTKDDSHNGDKFYELIIKTFKDSGIDEKISNLKSKDLDPKNFHEILSLHKFFIKKLRPIINQDDHSFCSKYLHFHLPNLYYLYDTTTSKSLSILGVKLNKLNKDQKKDFLERPEVYDSTYVKYFLKCYYFKEKLEGYFNRRFTIRELDTILLKIYNDNREKGKN